MILHVYIRLQINFILVQVISLIVTCISLSDVTFFLLKNSKTD